MNPAAVSEGPARGAALITGAGRRIGRALTLAIAGAGFDVVAHHHQSHADVETLAETVAGLGRRLLSVEADLADEAAVRGLIARCQGLGPLSLLINNAALFEDDSIQTLTAETWRGHMAVNLHAPILLSQAFAAALPEGRTGVILNMLDQRVWNPNPQFFSYSLSKSALWAATRTLAQALAPRIRVNGIGPGPTLASTHQSAEAFAAEARAIPLGQGVSPEQIAAAALYLIDASSVTGQMIAVDGGQHLSWRTPDVIGPPP
jgi:NAD(P)-dependent dehydrogenase (short-subunit alcohol dehydrogenase family)